MTAVTERSLIHHTFAIERRCPVSIDQVFAAWHDPATKRRWFTDDWGEHTLDFRVGGLENVSIVDENDKAITFESRYLDILDDQRIIYSSTLSANDVLSTSSITTVEFRAEGDATVQLLTESAVFLDGQEQPSWPEQGTGDWLTRLGETLEALPPTT